MIDSVCLCIRVAKFIVHVQNVNYSSWSLYYTTLNYLDERLQRVGGLILFLLVEIPHYANRRRVMRNVTDAIVRRVGLQL